MSYQIQALGVGSYQLTVLPAEGCMIDTLIEIRQASAHSIEIGKDTVHINQRQILSLEAKPSAGFTPVSVNWTPPQYVSCDTCFKTTAKPAGKTTFTVHALDSLGCTLKDEIVVYVDKKDDLYIPNAFNPEKEEFTVLGTSAVEKVLKMQIFDRWGTLLYEAQNKRCQYCC